MEIFQENELLISATKQLNVCMLLHV